MTLTFTLAFAFTANAEDITLRITENVPAAHTVEAGAALERSFHHWVRRSLTGGSVRFSVCGSILA